MAKRLHKIGLVALLTLGSAILLFSCKSKPMVVAESLDAIKTEESENLTIIMSENGRKSNLFRTPLLEGYTLGRDPYREFRKGISITTYQDDSLTTVNAVLVANYAIYYENRKLWEAKGDVVITKHDGTRLYTQQLFWNSITKRIYSNVDTRLVTDTDEVIGEGFESDEEMTEPRFRRWKGKMQVDTEQLRNNSDDDSDDTKGESKSDEKKNEGHKSVSAPERNNTPKKALGVEDDAEISKSPNRLPTPNRPTAPNRAAAPNKMRNTQGTSQQINGAPMKSATPQQQSLRRERGAKGGSMGEPPVRSKKPQNPAMGTGMADIQSARNRGAMKAEAMKADAVKADAMKNDVVEADTK